MDECRLWRGGATGHRAAAGVEAPWKSRGRAHSADRTVAPRSLDTRRFTFGRFAYYSSLTPPGAALGLSGHFVTGHRRELGPGQAASDYAAAFLRGRRNGSPFHQGL